MSTAASFSGRGAPWKIFHRRPTSKPAIESLAIKTTCPLGQNRLKTQQTSIPGHRNAENKLLNGHKLHPVMASKSTNNSNSSHLSPLGIIKEFYECINEKQLKRLGDYISEDCYIEECSFPTPIEGKEEVLHFFDLLIASMGENVKFKVIHLCEGDDQLIAAANWHLEWKKAQIPFTRGCSFFECSREGEKITIKKAQIVNESPIKPGSLVLTLLKIVTTLFDDFPSTTEWFLKSPHVILQWLLKIYNIIWTIFINPILKSYLHVWNFATLLHSYAFQILLNILKLFIK
ncbi:Polyketide cyclase SnoaL-like domain containing protein [Trema orientale]|uniref:Polyketide cyclase SnoaL-like domain containing protein n=1 Tax=Trema orientale TaxID=63057 RepID=A0A2P5FJ25_TREOI|nr:Polyketide cyclase SnoaL-like domain containing protein [Trema orientale]